MRACLRRFQAASQQQLQHHGATVGLQFQHVFAGVAVGAGKVNRQTVVNGRTLAVSEGQIGGLAGLEILAQQVAHKACQLLSGDTHNAHGPASGGCGNGDDGVVMARKHGWSSYVGLPLRQPSFKTGALCARLYWFSA